MYRRYPKQQSDVDIAGLDGEIMSADWRSKAKF
jgi:hypothetical protein